MSFVDWLLEDQGKLYNEDILMSNLGNKDTDAPNRVDIKNCKSLRQCISGFEMKICIVAYRDRRFLTFSVLS